MTVVQYTTEITDIIKSYFDNAVVVDDQLRLSREIDKVEEGSLATGLNAGAFGDRFFESTAREESAAATEEDFSDLPYKTFKLLFEEGFVTFPVQYTSNQDITALEKVLENAKLLIVDWNLDESKSGVDIGKTALKIIEMFKRGNKGLKCAVIYTQEPELVPDKLREHYLIHDDEVCFEEKDTTDSHPLFGFIMKKQEVQPDQIISKIADKLYENKSIIIHLMDSAVRLDKNLGSALQRFNDSFEKVILSQVITSDIPGYKVADFINGTILSTVMETETEGNSRNFLFSVKKNRIIDQLQKKSSYESSELNGLFEILDFQTKVTSKIALLFSSERFVLELVTLLQNDGIDSLTVFKERYREICKRNLEEMNNPVNPNHETEFIQSIVLFTTLLDNYIQADSKEVFIESFNKEAVKFSKLMKYTSDNTGRVNTGTIIKKGNKFYLCVTPYCDTYRIGEVDNKFKFLVGDQIEVTEGKHVKNNGTKHHILSVPMTDDNKFIFIKWKFYDVATIDAGDISKDEVVITLKKEYIQNILNKYLAYQSRAGVEEIFYKESSYVSNFIRVVK